MLCLLPLPYFLILVFFIPSAMLYIGPKEFKDSKQLVNLSNPFNLFNPSVLGVIRNNPCTYSLVFSLIIINSLP